MRFQLNSKLFNKLTMVISLQKALWSKFQESNMPFTIRDANSVLDGEPLGGAPILENGPLFHLSIAREREAIRHAHNAEIHTNAGGDKHEDNHELGQHLTLR